MSTTTAVALVLVVAILCLTGYLIIRLLVGQNIGGAGRLGLVVLGRSGENSTNWEPFIVAPVPHTHEPHDHPHTHNEEIGLALRDHIVANHGAHTHPDLDNSQPLNDLRGEVNELRLAVNNQQRATRRLRRLDSRLRIWRVSDFPYELIGAIIGAVVGLIIACFVPARLYSYPTVTKVVVNGKLTSVSHTLARDHWVLGGIVLAGLVVGLVLGFAAKYIFGHRTEFALAGQE